MNRELVSILAMAMSAAWACGADVGEFKVKRQEVFEFAQKPQVTRQGDRVSIAFETKGFCDVTVAIEDASGTIVRHLASGVLGANAPEPFQKNAKTQTIVWDGKNDQGRYVDEKDKVVIRVSLGLKPRFERTLFWSPQKRVGPFGPILCAAPEGVYIAEGYAVDHVRLFDHNGDYRRTIYPFPADKVDKVVGLTTHTFVQNGKALPLKHGYHQAALLTSGSNTEPRVSSEGFGATGIAARDGRAAVFYRKLNRLFKDGSTAGLNLEGPATTYLMKLRRPIDAKKDDLPGPRSGAFSPDGTYLYLTGWTWNSGKFWSFEWLPCVVRLQYATDAPPQLFAGSLKQGDDGSDDQHFKVPTSVAVDAKGRVYVSDYMNDRIQVFTPDGKEFKAITINRPAHVEVHQKTGEIYVFSWLLVTPHTRQEEKARPVYTRLGPVDDPQVRVSCPLPLIGHAPTRSWNISGGLPFRMTLDSWTDPPTIWLVPGAARWIHSGNGSILEDWERTGIQLLVEKDGQLVPKRSFGEEIKKTVVRPKPPILWRQRLYVNPKNGRLYVAEGDCGVMKAVNQLVEVDPDTGAIRLVDLPLGSEDLCFDVNGLAYLRTDTMVVRYDPTTWRQIPWDYGEERETHSYGMGARGAPLVAGLVTPGHRSFNFWHLGGIDVSLKGRLVVTTCNGEPPKDRRAALRQKIAFRYRKSTYSPTLYPGRLRWGEVHVWDERGRKVYEDAAPGIGHMNGIGIDPNDNIYMLLASRRLIDGKPIDPGLERDVSGTLVKVAAKKAKVLSSSGRGVPIPLSEDARPKRPPDVTGYTTGWIEGAKWFYGGVGFCTPGGCVCWNSRFDLDYFNRSFAPEPLCFSVAVLDSSGNLILRIGNYGNVDDGVPLVKQGGPPNPRSLGGDEVALAHACYVATHTDRRLFIADAGNARIVSVKLDYYATERVSLRDVPEKDRP